jgi:hypothetical protein
MELHYRRGAIGGVTGSTFARFHDFEAYSSIDRITFEYMNKDIYVIRGDELMFIHTTLLRDEHFRTTIGKQQHGYRTEYERNVLGTGTEAANGNVWVVADLQVPWVS